MRAETHVGILVASLKLFPLKWILKNCTNFSKILQYQISQKLFSYTRILWVQMDGQTSKRGGFNL